jgi:iron(III) transport system ATP-binding protein
MVDYALATDRTREQGSPAQGAEVHIQGLVKAFRDPHNGMDVLAVDDVDLHVGAGEFCVLLGPSGCGKTTLLRCIAGLEEPTNGSITVDGSTVFDDQGKVNLAPQQRPIGMVFQNYALWPHMDVAGNVGFALKSAPRSARLSSKAIQERVHEVLELVSIGHLAHRKVGQLSGGQQQRVALARALASGNKVVLFDEPLSNIDAKVRERLRRELRAMQLELGFTAIYVTHDQAEAMEMADEIAVLREGRVAQLGEPREIFFHPKTSYVADFIGATNLLRITEPVVAGQDTVMTGQGPIHVRTRAFPEGDALRVSSKAQHWQLTPQELDTPRDNTWEGELTQINFMGEHTEFVVQLPAETVRVWGGDIDVSVGDRVTVHIPPHRAEVIIDDRDA